MSRQHLTINPSLIVWARQRSGRDPLTLERQFPRLADWEKGVALPTLRQLENFARSVHVPIGYLFLPHPPQEKLPIPDCRTLADRPMAHPSPDLLDTLYICQQRQDWYRQHVRQLGLSACDFIGSATLRDDPVAVAASIRKTLRLSLSERRRLPGWNDALRQFIGLAEEAGVLVMASSIVGSNSHRHLSVDEFRGFALADDLAPLVFLNAADSKAAQMFTLAHELAHLWAGESGVSDSEVGRLPEHAIERWCNRVAAELLMPIDDLRQVYRSDLPLTEEIQQLAKMFKVSTLVAMRRLFDAGFIDQATLWQSYQEEIIRLRTLDRRRGGEGNFYHTLSSRTGKRFARALLASTLEGQTLFQEAFHLLGVKKSATFYQAARVLGVMA